MKKKLYKKFKFKVFCAVHRCFYSTIQYWQAAQFKRLCRHAFTNVPMWREIFSEANIDAECINGIETLKDLPLTNKKTYIGRFIEEYIDGSRYFIRRTIATSGSSGQPFEVFLPECYNFGRNVSEFASYRFLSWDDQYKKKIDATKISRIKGAPFSYPSRFGIKYTDFLESPRDVFTRLAEFMPDVLVAYPSVLFDIARMIDSDSTLPQLKPLYALSTGELLTPEVRSYIAKILGAEVYNRYALAEVDVVGTECARHDGFHINSESIIVEITNEDGNQLPEEENGKVIVTSLINYNMPFIRYDTGDRGYLSTRPCPCGLYTPRLWLEGRESAYLMFNDRRISRFDFFFGPYMRSIFQFQIVKRTENQLLLRVVPGPAWENNLGKKIKDLTNQFVGSDINVSIELVSGISKAPSGKSNLLVDESVSTGIQVYRLFD